MKTLFINKHMIPLVKHDDSLIFYPHSQRTGGRTVRNKILQKVFNPNQVYFRKNGPYNKKWLEVTKEDLQGFRVYTGTSNYSNIALSRTCLPIAVLRHPFYRAISLYSFVKHREDHRYHEQAQLYSPEEFSRFMAETSPKYFCNVQCLRICGKPDATEALKTIHDYFLAVGFTDYLSEFATALCDLFGWPAMSIDKMPPDVERYKNRLSADFCDVIANTNSEDIKLFETLKSLFCNS
jgi:hypothetical protein